MLPNLLSLLRLFLAIPFLYVMQLEEFPNQRLVAFSIVILAGITDKLDGYFARKLNQFSEYGIIIDPLADKIGIGIFVITLWLWNNISIWFLIVILGRDLLILSFSIYLKMKFNKVLKSNLTGKITICFVVLALVVALLNYSQVSIIKEIIIWIATLYSFYSLYLYWEEFKKAIEISE